MTRYGKPRPLRPTDPAETTDFSRRLEAFGFANYDEYLQSDRWAAKKAEYKSSGRLQVCFLCGCDRWDMHHRSYKRLGSERMGDLIPLCRRCHQQVHDYVEKNKGRKGASLWYAAATIRCVRFKQTRQQAGAYLAGHAQKRKKVRAAG